MNSTQTSFAPLPRPLNAKGDARLTGVEIELGGLDEARVAALVAERLDGRAEQEDSHIWAVSGSDIGDVAVYLDIFLRKAQKSRLRDLALDLGREVVPVEIVTEPIDMEGLARLDDLRHARLVEPAQLDLHAHAARLALGVQRLRQRGKAAHGRVVPAAARVSRRGLRARSVADLSCPQAAMISSPRGVRMGLA